jgi:hypothetical protein
MKKILALSVTAFILINHVQAQTKKTPSNVQIKTGGATEGNVVQKVELVFKTIKVEDGANSITVAKLKGALSFVKKDDRYSAVVFTDSTGKTRSLTIAQPGAACTYTTADKQITVHFCETARKLSGTTSRQTTLTIAL